MNATCQIPIDKIESFADGDLCGHEARLIEQHLEACEHCKGILEEHYAIKSAIRGGFEHFIPDSETPGEWEAIVSQLDFRPSLWQRIIERIQKPSIWIPAFAATAAAVIISIIFIMPNSHAPAMASQVESVSVSSASEQVWVLQTAQTGQPLIWIQSETKTEKEAG